MTAEPMPLVSIIVNNYNYGRFLRESIDSALAQTYPRVEVLVVDDGSTDDSPRIIASYGDRVTALLKPNGGQSSAFNLGFRASRGRIVIFVDSDDTLDPTAVEAVVPLLRDSDVVKAHFPLRVIEASGKDARRIHPAEALPEGDFREAVILRGPDKFIHPPTTGNAFARAFLEKVFPLPEIEKRWGLGDANGDAHLSSLALLYGRIARLSKPHGCYRIHGTNGYIGLNFDGRLRRDLITYNHRCESLASHCRRIGIEVVPDTWRADAWLYRLRESAREIANIVPDGERFILVDQDQWGMDGTGGRRAVPFTEKDGRYWGPPADDGAAVREVERLQQSGTRFMVFAWTARWWLDHYRGLRCYLDENAKRVLENDRLVAFDLRPTAVAAAQN
jgi:glycosyltransferase involved in cell wall biosynthesis